MKYQLNAYIKSLMKAKIWIIIYVLLFLINYYAIVNMRIDSNITRQDMLGLLGMLYGQKSIFTSNFLFFLYQIFTIIYITHLFYTFEENSSKEFIQCRISKKHLQKLKVLVSTFGIIILRLFNFLLVFNLMHSFVSFTLKDFTLNILIYLIVELFYMIIVYLKNNSFKIILK